MFRPTDRQSFMVTGNELTPQINALLRDGWAITAKEYLGDGVVMIDLEREVKQ